MKKKHIILILLVFMLVGCTPSEGNLVTPESTGIWANIVKFFSYSIIYTGKLLGNNIILGLIFMTIVSRVMMIPLYKAQIKSTENINKIKPEMTRIQNKYKDKKDRDSQMKYNQELQILYKKNNINPLAGCLPMLIQLPLLFAFYGAISNLMLYKQDGQTGLELFSVTDMSTNFLFWNDMGQPIIVLAFIAAILTFVSTKLSSLGTETDGNPMMSSMMYTMPVMILVMGFNLPGALSLYWVVGSIIQVIQTTIIRRESIKNALDKKKLKK